MGTLTRTLKRFFRLLLEAFSIFPLPDSFMFRRIFKKELKLNKSDTSLDLGGGDGMYTNLLGHRCKTVISLDLQDTHFRPGYPNPYKGALIRAQTLSRYNSHFICGDACAIPLKAGTVDKILASQLLEHLEDIASVMSEISRVLRNKGIVVISSPNSDFIKRYRFPLTKQFRKLAVKIYSGEALPGFWGQWVRNGFEEWEKQVGHIRHGVSESELTHLAQQYGLCKRRVRFVHSKFSSLFLELYYSLPVLHAILKPIILPIYIVESVLLLNNGFGIVMTFKKCGSC